MRLLLLACVILPSSGRADDFTTPAAIAAREAYEADLKTLRNTYSNALITAMKEAKGAGDDADAERIEEARIQLTDVLEDDSIEESATTKARRMILRKRWHFREDKARTWQRFFSDGTGVNYAGTKTVWTLANPTTLISQSHGTSRIYVWRFNDNYSNVVVNRFDLNRSYVRTGHPLD